MNLYEMSMPRADAIDRCVSLGKRFIEHFHKVYVSPYDEAVNHWVTELENWYKLVKEIRLKPKGNFLGITFLNDCFFTAGAEPTDFVEMSDKEFSDYERFYTALDRGLSVREALKEIILNIKI